MIGKSPVRENPGNQEKDIEKESNHTGSHTRYVCVIIGLCLE
jgi:hypothetical protein